MNNTIQTIIFDRTDPHQVVSIRFAGKYGSGEATKTTRANDLLSTMHHRADMAMVNFWDASGSVYKQGCVYVGRDGIKWGNVQRFFTEEQQAEIEAIRLRIIALADGEYPQFAKYLYTYL